MTITPACAGSSSPYGVCTPSTAVVSSRWVELSKKEYKTLTGDELTNDWGLLILNQNIGTATGYLGVKWNDSTLLLNSVSVRGYADSKPYQQWYASGKITWDEGGILDHNCDTLNGSSGGPIIDSAGKICGINIGSASDGSSNIAIKITKDLYSTIIARKLTPPGRLELVNSSTIGGHGFNKNNYNEKVDVHIYIRDSKDEIVEGIAVKANLFRDGVGYRAFHYNMNWKTYVPGVYKVYAYAIYDNNPSLKNCPYSFTVRSTEGKVDSLGKTGISGWTWKPDAPNSAIEAHLYIYDSSNTMVLGKVIKANEYRADLVTAGKGNGYHGFSYSIDWSTLPKGTLKVKVYSVDGSGNNPQFWSGTYNNQ